MKLDIVQIGIGAAVGYYFARMMTEKDAKTDAALAKTDAALGALHLGALQMNPYGAIQMNPSYGALHMNPRGAHSPQGARAAYSPAGLQTQQAGYGALQINPNDYGALHLGALAQVG